MSTNKKWIGLGLLTALAGSACCIAPLLALLAGTTGWATSFSWLSPYRPYCIALSFIVLAVAWYKQLKPPAPRKEDACGCPETCRKRPARSFILLGLATLFCLSSLALPYYSSWFYGKQETTALKERAGEAKQIAFDISGMTCDGCARQVEQGLRGLGGVLEAHVSYDKGEALISYWGDSTDRTKLETAIRDIGYSITGTKEN